MPGVRATFSHVASPCPMRNCSVSAGEQGDPATGSSLFRALELAGGTVPGAVEVEAWSSGGRSSEHLSLWDVGANPVLTGPGGDFLQTAHPGRQESWGPGTRDLFPVVSTAEQSVLPRVPAPKWEGRAVQGIHPRRGPKPPPAAGWTPDNLVQEQKSRYFYFRSITFI